MPRIYIDESGQFTKCSNDRFFVVGSFTTGDSKRTAKEFIKWQREKAPQPIRKQPEWKFTDRVNDDTRIKTLRFIANLDIKMRFSFLETKNIPSSFRHHNKIKAGDLYTHVIGETINQYCPINDLELRVFCDERHLKGVTKADFKKILISRFGPNVPAQTVIQIEMLDSKQQANIQIADWIAGAYARYLEKKPFGDECYRMIKNNISSHGEEELFKEYWADTYAKQKTEQ
jgi:Protein of unknown function (DUF3800)